jgi:hypothetical protein
MHQYLTVSTHFFTVLSFFWKNKSRLLRSPCSVIRREGWHLNGIWTCVLSRCVVCFTNLTDCYYICYLFNMTCTSLVPILSKVNVVSAIHYGWVNIHYQIWNIWAPTWNCNMNFPVTHFQFVDINTRWAHPLPIWELRLCWGDFIPIVWTTPEEWQSILPAEL